jgi:hypothetical protein
MSKINEFIEGINILKKYDNKIGDSWMSAEHDQIWFGENAEEIKGKLSPEDLKFLLGTFIKGETEEEDYWDGGVFFIDEDGDCFSMFV